MWSIWLCFMILRPVMRLSTPRCFHQDPHQVWQHGGSSKKMEDAPRRSYLWLAVGTSKVSKLRIISCAYGPYATDMLQIWSGTGYPQKQANGSKLILKRWCQQCWFLRGRLLVRIGSATYFSQKGHIQTFFDSSWKVLWTNWCCKWGV